MKFLYCTDIHIKGKNPVNRIDNYYQSCLEKIDNIIDIAKVNKCDCIVCGGDLFDSPYISNTVVDDFVDRVEDSELMWWVVAGNHDMTSHNWELSKSSALAHIFRRSTSVRLLNEIDLTDTLDNVYIKGYNYYHNIEEDFKEKGLFHKQGKAFTIAVPHAFISIKPFFKDVAWICAKDLKTNYDIVLCSHFHVTFDEIINDTRFINSNAIGRVSIIAKHQPEVLIVDTVTRDIKKIKLDKAKEIEEIFDLSKYEELKDKEKNIKDFLDSLKDINFQAMDLSQQIERIGKVEKVDNKVIHYLLEKIYGDEK